MTSETFKQILPFFRSDYAFMHIFHEPGSGVVNAIQEVSNNTWHNKLIHVNCEDINEGVDFVSMMTETEELRKQPVTLVLSGFNRISTELYRIIMKYVFHNYSENFARGSKIIILEHYPVEPQTYSNDSKFDYAVHDKFARFNITRE